jgi:hypothetical protein
MVQTMLKIRLLMLLSIAVIALAACSPDELDEVENAPAITEGITFRSIDEIIDAELEVTNFANDGTATSDHNPLLSGLEPDTEYYFRTQGVDDDGNIYLSEVITFTTPPLDTSQAEIENLASPENGAEIIGYSSAFGGAELDDRWGAGSAFDDNPNSEWSSAGDGNDAWVEIELERRARIDSVDFRSRSMSDGTAIALAFTITTDDGETFGPFELPDTDSSYAFDIGIEAKALRFDLVNTTGGNTGVVDIAVYGEFAGE